MAHRGASGAALENTLAAFRLARVLGADGVELDIHATADGGLVVHHDPVLPGLGPIARHPLANIQTYKLANGEPPPTLEEALATLDGLDVWVEVKDLPPDSDAALLTTLDRGPTPRRYAVHSFDHRIVARLKARRPALATGVLQASYPLDPIAPAQDAGARTLWQEWTHIDRALTNAAHAAGVQVIAWTVPDDAAATRLTRLGVDALCGNYPDRLRAAAEAAG